MKEYLINNIRLDETLNRVQGDCMGLEIVTSSPRGEERGGAGRGKGRFFVFSNWQLLPEIDTF